MSLLLSIPTLGVPSPTIVLENPGVQNGNPDIPKVILQMPLEKRPFPQLLRRENRNLQQLAPEDPSEIECLLIMVTHTSFLLPGMKEDRRREQ